MTNGSNGSASDLITQLQQTIEIQNRTIRMLLSNYDDLLSKWEAEQPVASPAAAPTPPPVPEGKEAPARQRA